MAVLRKQLASDDDATVACAAYRAGKNDRKELVPDLRHILRELHAESPKRKHSRDLACSVMDAIVQLHGRLPTTELAPWFKIYQAADAV